MLQAWLWIKRRIRVYQSSKKENIQLLTENNTLKADIGYWQSCHKRALEREAALKRELQDKNARIKYLTRQLYEKKTKRSKKSSESDKTKVVSGKRNRGQQPDRPAPKPGDRSHLPAKEEVHDLSKRPPAEAVDSSNPRLLPS